jgi:hypothetical protein
MVRAPRARKDPAWTLHDVSSHAATDRIAELAGDAICRGVGSSPPSFERLTDLRDQITVPSTDTLN